MRVQQENDLTEELRNNTGDSSKLINQILDVKSAGANNYDVLSLLYHRIYSFLVYKNKQLSVLVKGDPKYDSIQREVNTALESVIPRNALSPFIMLTNPEKATQLSELSNLVLGIRLFNKKIGKGGESLADVDTLASALDTEFIEQVSSSLSQTQTLASEYENYLLHLVDNNIQDPNFEVLKRELIFLRQFLSSAMMLWEKTEISLNNIEVARSRYHKEVSDLKNLLSNNSSAPKEQVYPKFSTLSTSYLTLVEESKAAQQKKQLFGILTEIISEASLSLVESQSAAAYRYAESQKKEEERVVRYDNKNNVYYIEFRNTPEFINTPLDFSGFSLVSLVEQEGLLVSGQHAFGIFKFEDNMLIFHSHREIRKFMERPQFYLDKFYQICRKYPTLIPLLNADTYFRDKNLRILEMKEDLKDTIKTMSDATAQTPVHFVEKHFDHNYFWNEWELRKKAIQMANIRNMTTKATQTSDSIFKVENETQVWLKKEACTMTGIEAGTNPIRPRNYITELREKTGS